jgi:CHAT domain-containing protein/Tfp pilus assembly protein PilF
VRDVDPVGQSHLDHGYAILQQGGDAERAVDALRTAAGLLAGSELEAAANDQLGRALMRVGRFEEAVEPLARAIEVAGPAERAGPLSKLAVVNAESGDYLKAASLFRAAFSDLEATGLVDSPIAEVIRTNASEVATLSNNHATRLADQGRLEEAVELFEAALGLLGEDEDDKRGPFQTNLGDAYRRLGRLTDAEATLRSTLALAPDDSPSRARRLNGLAHVYISFAAPERALPMFEEALAIQRAKSTDLEVAGTLRNVAEATERIDGPEAALPVFEKALATLRDTGENVPPRERAMALTALGGAHLRAGRHEAARSYLEQAIPYHDESGHESSETASAIHLLGRVHELAGRHDEARERFTEALGIRERSGSAVDATVSLEALARLDHAAGNLNAAIERLDRSRTIVEAARARVAGSSSRAGLFERMQPVYQELIACLAERDLPGDAARALFCAESARGRALLDAITAPAVPSRAEELEARRELARAHEAYRVAAADASRTPDELQGLRARTGQLEELAHRAASLDLLDPGAAPLTAEEIQAELDPGTLLIEYDATGEEMFVWGVRRDAIAMKRLQATEAELSGTVEWLVGAYLTGPGAAATELSCAELGELLLDPLPETLWDGAERVVVVADGVLHYLPFELLPRPRDGAPLIDSLPVAYAHSFSAQVALRARGKGHVRDGLEFAGFANPPVSDGEGVERWAALGLNLPDIENTEREVDAACALFGDRGVAIKGPDATERRVREAVKGCRYVHFATHGLYDDDAPQMSGLVLAPPTPAERDSPGGGELDSFLQAFELAELDLAADLVVFSACVTAMGRVQHGEGIVNMTNASLAAGASGVVASVWFVDDEATAELMKAFYRQLHRGSSVCEALRLAKLALRDSENHNDPYYWAAFLATGAVL